MDTMPGTLTEWRRRAERSARAGFTLIEVMVVAVVIAILATILIPNVVGRIQQARQSAAKANIAVFETAIENFHVDMGRYPLVEEGLRVLFYAPDDDEEKWAGPYLTKPDFKDPWGNDYVYTTPGSHPGQAYEIISHGRDGQKGGEGHDADIDNWIEEDESP